MSDFERQGWRQGSVLPNELAAQLLPEAAIGTGDIAIVVSQDCDVTNADLDVEPHVELLVASPLPSADGNFTFGKHPRRLHLDTSDGIVEVSVQRRHLADRAPLRVSSPAGTTIDADSVRILSAWMARRYDRAAFPTAFNDRLRAREKLINRALKKCRQISAVFVQMDFSELGAGSDYVIRVMGAIRDDDNTQANRAAALGALDKLCSEIDSCDGIRVDDHELFTESEITLNDLRFIRRLEVGYLSDRADPPDPVSPR